MCVSWRGMGDGGGGGMRYGGRGPIASKARRLIFYKKNSVKTNIINTYSEQY
jgi:hypothetical protein